MAVSGGGDCCFCHGEACGKESLLSATSKGRKTLLEIATGGQDIPLTNLIHRSLVLKYHRACYVYYKRGKSESNKENENTPLKGNDTNGPPFKKRTRLSPTGHDENLCIICQKNSWNKRLSCFTGDMSAWLETVSSDDVLLDRFVTAKQSNLKIVYHMVCKLSPEKYMPPKTHKNIFSTGHFGPTDISAPDDLESRNKVHVDDGIIMQAATLLRKSMINLPKSVDYEVSHKAAQAAVPHLLKTFVACLFECPSDSLSHPHALSIAQDIMYCVGKVRTAKHISLASNLRKLTGSKSVVSLISDLGHCISYVDALRMETVAANRVLQSFAETQVYIPENLNPGQFVFAAADNIDFGNATSDGMGTTHGINMILYQPGDMLLNVDTKVSIPAPSTNLQLTTTDLYGHISIRQMKPPAKVVPMPAQTAVLDEQDGMTTSTNPCIHITRQWVDERQKNTEAPTWYAYNGRLVSESIPTKLSYLPMINESAQSPVAVYKCIKVLQMTLLHINQAPAVIYMDQAMYAVGQMVKWANISEFSNLLFMMGGFHISMNFLSALGTMFGHLGWSHLLLDSGVFTKRVVELLIDAKPYTRCLEAHLAVYEALCFMRNDVYKDWASSHPQGSIDDMIEEFSQTSVLFKFWNMYLQAVELVLTHLYAERTGNWPLYVRCLENMLPYFFVTDRVKYARWLSVHVHELQCLRKKWPAVYSQFISGNFVVNHTRNAFSSVSGDQALEQTLNKETKCSGGLIGNTTNDNARNRWFLTSHIKANMLVEMQRMRSKQPDAKTNFPHHTDNRCDQQKSRVWPEKIYDHLTNNGIEPFCCQSELLVNIITGDEWAKDESNKICNGLVAASVEANTFMEDCVRREGGSIHKTLTKMNIPFQHKPTKPRSKATNKACDTAEIRRLSQLAIVASTRQLDLSEHLTTERCKFPPSLCHHDGAMRKTDKSQLRRSLEFQLPDSSVRKSHPAIEPELSCMVVDGMAAIHKQKPVASSFGEYATGLFSRLVHTMRSNSCSRLDVVFDRYGENSIKQMERDRRQQDKRHGVIRINHKGTKIPLNWQDYMSVDQNKANLVDFLISMVQSDNVTGLLKTTEMIVCGGRGSTVVSTRSGVHIEESLTTNHDEADTMIVFHIKEQLAVRSNFVVLSDDTDVFVLLVHFLDSWQKMNVRIWFLTGKDEKRYIPIHEVVEAVAPNSARLIGLHSISGCDSVNSVFGISKSKAYKVMTNHDSLCQLGSTTSPCLDNMRSFFYDLYGQKDSDGTMDQLRYKLIAERGAVGEALPPSDDVLVGHVKRANYQAYIWKQSDQRLISTPDPESHGWTKESGRYVPHYGTSSRPVQFVSCGCSGACNTRRCVCKRAEFRCTDVCRCKGDCVNKE